MLSKLNDEIYSELQVSYNQNKLSNPLQSSADTVRILRLLWNASLMNIQEQVYVLFLNRNNQVICWRCLHTGGSSSTSIDLKILLGFALKPLSHGLIIAHNHPSGRLKPSIADITITKNLIKICEILEINLLDHIILTDEGYYSFKDHDLI